MGVFTALTIALTACTQDGYIPVVPHGNPDRGREAIEQYECGVCHVIPGVNGARGQVGPPLHEFQRRVYIAGKFPNTPEMLVPWIRDAPSMAPLTAMPAIVMSDGEARDMAAYLYTLE